MTTNRIESRREFVSDHPLRLAEQIAKLLDSDPIAASQVCEHLSVERIRELLELPPAQTESVEEAMEFCNCSMEDFENHFRDAVLNQLSPDELIERLKGRGYNKVAILTALNS